ncbi:MAG: succinate dehydrogenase, cytochrome b556 subunit [Proteobacteria bacterium]|jgi:succinate dehydrogenase / fumarate reductase, cytochrome b subunit|nr:succinate dehydrogenase, cytochrome b556 subunit [Pseudomonadota bacterium]
MLIKTQRPKYLNLLKIRQPMTAIVSIAHRISGVILFLAVPIAIYGLALSLRSAEDYAAIKQTLHSPGLQLFLLLMAWAILHHFFAGIRFLLLDLDIGLKLKTARASAWTVFVLVGAILLVIVTELLT